MFGHKIVLEGARPQGRPKDDELTTLGNGRFIRHRTVNFTAGKESSGGQLPGGRALS